MQSVVHAWRYFTAPFTDNTCVTWDKARWQGSAAAPCRPVDELVEELRAASPTTPGGIAIRKYALTTPVTCDAVDVLRASQNGDMAAALHRYRGPLLPRSEAPGIMEWRARLEVAVRAAVLASILSGTCPPLWWRAPYDAEVHEHALGLLSPDDTRRAIAAG